MTYASNLPNSNDDSRTMVVTPTTFAAETSGTADWQQNWRVKYSKCVEAKSLERQKICWESRVLVWEHKYFRTGQRVHGGVVPIRRHPPNRKDTVVLRIPHARHPRY